MGRRGLVGAWLVGEALYVWRVAHRYHRPPVPGDLLGITALFAVLGLVSEYQPAAGLVAMVGWGLDVAAFMRLFPAGLGEQISKVNQQEENAAAGAGAAEGSGGGVGEGSGGRL